MAFLTGGDSTLYSLHQDGSKLSGSVEGGDISFFGGSDAPLPLTDGTVDGSKVTFKAGSSTYTGTVNGDRLELKRVIKLPFEWNRRPEPPPGPRPAIGPPPDGSDPSIDSSWEMPPDIPVVLRRVQR